MSKSVYISLSGKEVNLSDRGRAVAALTEDRDNLMKQSAEVYEKITALHGKFTEELKKLSALQEDITKKLVAVEDAMSKLLGHIR